MAVSMEDVVRVLQNRIGYRWEGIEADGRDEMIRVLKKDFDLSTTEADDIIDGLVRSGTVRYEIGETADTDRPVDPDLIDEPTLPRVALPIAGLGGAASTGGIAAVAAIPLGAGGGYWRIGNEGDV